MYVCMYALLIMSLKSFCCSTICNATRAAYEVLNWRSWVRQNQTLLLTTPVVNCSYMQRHAFLLILNYFVKRGKRWRSWLRHCATSRKVAGSIPDGVARIFQ